MTKQTMTLLVMALLAVGILSGCASRSGPPASVEYDKSVSPYHVVKKGDSIASISRKYGMDKRELIRTNGLESPYRIVKGQRLLVRPHKSRETAQDDRDDSDPDSPASEELGNVPDEGDVQIKPLAPVPGIGSDGGMKGGVPSTGKMNPEIDDEAESETDEANSDSKAIKYDEEKIDEAEGHTKRPAIDSGIAAAPPAAGVYTWPAQGTVTRGFSPKGKGKAQNDGINIAAAKGAPVVAANNGVVAHAGNQLRGFGNVVLVKHDNGTMTVYAHLDKVSDSIKKGAVVKAGQKLGTVGQTGTVNEPQLHFEIRKGRTLFVLCAKPP
jgi:murein DD-endopeptidase MepM/ murein hydrolase activator NlpD